MNNIKTRRKQQKLSQLELAHLLNVSQQAIAKWESSKSQPRADKLPELARALCCTIDDLYQDNTEQKGA